MKFSIPLSLLLLCWLPSSLVFSQTTIFSENIGNTPVAAPTAVSSFSGFQNNGIAAYSGNADVRTTSPSGGSGGNNVFLNSSGNTTFTISNININGATAILLTFGLHKSTVAETGSSLVVSIVVDGGAPITYSPTLPTGSGSAVWHTITPAISIPNGLTMSITFTNSSTSNAFRIDDLVLTSQTPLPVIFGKVEAVFSKENDILVKWTTLTETNSDHYEVELSPDGSNFKKAGWVQSKATGGATQELSYEFTIGSSFLASLFSIPWLVMGLGFAAKKRKKLPGALIIFALVLFNIVSCSKTEVGIATHSKSNRYLRIVQVDVDGSRQYSKIVQVVNE